MIVSLPAAVLTFDLQDCHWGSPGFVTWWSAHVFVHRAGGIKPEIKSLQQHEQDLNFNSCDTSPPRFPPGGMHPELLKKLLPKKINVDYRTQHVLHHHSLMFIFPIIFSCRSVELFPRCVTVPQPSLFVFPQQTVYSDTNRCRFTGEDFLDTDDGARHHRGLQGKHRWRWSPRRDARVHGSLNNEEKMKTSQTELSRRSVG